MNCIILISLYTVLPWNKDVSMFLGYYTVHILVHPILEVPTGIQRIYTYTDFGKEYYNTTKRGGGQGGD